jgi:hypothetical protein
MYQLELQGQNKADSFNFRAARPGTDFKLLYNNCASRTLSSGVPAATIALSPRQAFAAAGVNSHTRRYFVTAVSQWRRAYTISIHLGGIFPS